MGRTSRAKAPSARGEGARLRGGAGGHRDLPATLRGWQCAGDARLWKFIVSPEHAERLDLKTHTRALGAQMERDLGARIEWVAIAHYNTDNPHVHLLVRARDVQTEALQVHRDYLKQEIRRHSQDLATQALPFTDLDRALVRHGGSRGLVTVTVRSRP